MARPVMQHETIPGPTDIGARVAALNARYKHHAAFTVMEKALRAGGDENLQRIDEAMEIYGRIFDANCTYHVISYKGIPELLKEMKAMGIGLAVLSNKPDRQTAHVVETEVSGLCRW